MNAKMIIVTTIAVLATTVAVIEGVMLAHRPAAAPPPTVVAQAPADAALPAPPAPPPAPAQKNTTPAAEPVAPRATPKDSAVAAALPPDHPNMVDAPALTATSALSVTSVELPLTDEEKDAREKAVAKAKFQEGVALQMDQAAKQMIDALKLTDAQKQMAAPTIEKLRQAMGRLVTAPMQAGQEMGQKIEAIRQSGLAAHQSQDQIDAQIKTEQASLSAQIQNTVVGGLTTVSTTLDELRPILDVQQSTTLDQMQKQLQQQQAMMKKMMGAMTEPADTPAASAP